jgi:hypothetical protein
MLTTEPAAHLVAFAGIQALIGEYFSGNVLRQDYLMTCAIRN